MVDIKQTLLDNAKSKFLKGEVNAFVEILQNLYNSYLICNCFLKEQPSYLWETLAKKANTLEDNSKAFDINFAKGFIHLYNEDEKIAFDYLTNAININPTSDTCFSLRATIDQTINDFKINDAQQAVKLNPIARNYFVLATVYSTYGQHIDSITCYDKVNLINKKVACAFNNKASNYQSLEDNAGVLDSLVDCLEIEPNHWCYENLFYYLRLNKKDLYIKYIKRVESIIMISTWGRSLPYDDLFFLYENILFSHNYKLDLSETNPYFSKINSTINSYLDKISNSEPVNEEEENANKLMVYKDHYKIRFGKYTDFSIKQIIQTDPQYIIWCIINLIHFSISLELFLEENLKTEVGYLEALEINLVKNKLVNLKKISQKNEDNYNGSYGDSFEDYDPFEGDYLAWFNYNQ